MFLEGVRVLDLSRVLAGPFATQILGDMGAEILKVEAPGGDDTRAWGPPFQGDMAAYFQSCNRNKASLVLDLKQGVDSAMLRRLVAAADVVVDNFPPQVRARLGLDGTTLAALNPRLVCMSITGYRGAREDEAGYDIMVQAESGWMGMTGPSHGEPFKVGVAVVDVLTGMMAANGILGALFRRERHGTGARLSVSLYQTALLSLVNVAANHLVSGDPTPRWGNEHANIVPYQDFRLADRAVIIGVGNDRQFRRLCGILDIDDAELLAMDNAQRVAQRKRVVAALQEKLGQMRGEQLVPLLKREKIPVAPILRPDEALTQVKQWDPGAVFALEHGTLGQMRLLDASLVGEGMRRDHRPPPTLGEGGRNLAARWLEATNRPD